MIPTPSVVTLPPWCPVCDNQRVTWAFKPDGWVAVQVACFACCGGVPVGVPGRSGK